jgi:hypothetical protein
VSFNETWNGDDCSLQVEGEIRQVRVFGENLRLKRRITTGLGGNYISIRNGVENPGAATSPLMLLYHINLGFPLLDERGELVAEPHPVELPDIAGEPGLHEWMRFQKPTLGYAEQVFYNDLPTDNDGWAGVHLVNRARKLGVHVLFQKATLPNLVQ